MRKVLISFCQLALQMLGSLRVFSEIRFKTLFAFELFRKFYQQRLLQTVLVFEKQEKLMKLKLKIISHATPSCATIKTFTELFEFVL